MTRIAKLYAATVANPRYSLSFRDFERLLTAFGFGLVRATGWSDVARGMDFSDTQC